MISFVYAIYGTSYDVISWFEVLMCLDSLKNGVLTHMLRNLDQKRVFMLIFGCDVFQIMNIDVFFLDLLFCFRSFHSFMLYMEPCLCDLLV